ncbi:hypothetical protein Scep_022760 [Stephania cephalantha]|uniref:Gnk2-homologous domain-containing protein n=1 Tax=Stephania cephalantha TaxID=152367 RepID=A0AAP0I2E5_9MAGN
MPSLHVLFLLMTTMTVSYLPNPSISDTESFIYGGCSQMKYPPSSPYESNLNSLLTSLVNSATFSSYNNFTITSPQDGSSAPVYGLFQCRGDLSSPDCSRCVSRAVSQLGVLCNGASGGAIQLQGCLVKYDNSTFLGVEDKTVVLKKCGVGTPEYDSDMVARRDAVLAGMASGEGSTGWGGRGGCRGYRSVWGI